MVVKMSKIKTVKSIINYLVDYDNQSREIQSYINDNKKKKILIADFIGNSSNMQSEYLAIVDGRLLNNKLSKTYTENFDILIFCRKTNYMIMELQEILLGE